MWEYFMISTSYMPPWQHRKKKIDTQEHEDCIDSLMRKQTIPFSRKKALKCCFLPTLVLRGPLIGIFFLQQWAQRKVSFVLFCFLLCFITIGELSSDSSSSYLIFWLHIIVWLCYPLSFHFFFLYEVSHLHITEV